MVDYIAIEHERFKRAQRGIFTRRVTPDCMNHQCRLIRQHGRLKLDACCQYGVDCDVAERDGILEHREQIAGLLVDEAAEQPWFTDQVSDDPDFPSGRFVRTQRLGEGCIFLAHDGRGCAIHRASIEGGWDYRGVKPHVCRLFPVSYDAETICISDDYTDYSCSMVPGAPTLYRVARDVLGEIFGEALVVALDAAEAEVERAESKLRLIAHS